MTTRGLLDRQVLKTSRFGARHLRAMLQCVFSMELLQPSQPLWIVSPWISDVDLLDNRAGGYSRLEPSWPTTYVRLGTLLERLLEAGGELRIVTRSGAPQESLLQSLTRFAESEALSHRLHVSRVDELHTKGLLGRDFFLSGSMNLTWNGLHRLEEGVVLTLDRARIAEAHVAFDQAYGPA